MPDIEMMQALSVELEVSINELLSGARIPDESYKEKAEENFTTILHTSNFTLKEKCTYFKRKWQKEHLLSQILLLLVFATLYIYGFVTGNLLAILITSLGLFITALISYNRMQAYVEMHAFDGSGKDT